MIFNIQMKKFRKEFHMSLKVEIGRTFLNIYGPLKEITDILLHIKDWMKIKSP